MRGLFWLLTLFALAVAAALLAHNEGFVLFILPPWRMELAFNLFLLFTLLAFLLLYGAARSLKFSLSLSKRAHAFRTRREENAAVAAVEEALRLLFAGRYGHALRAAEHAWEAKRLSGTAALIAARAAQRMREYEKTLLWLSRARMADDRIETAVSMVSAEAAIDAGDYPGALKCLSDLQKQEGLHIAALRLELRARQGTGDMEAVIKLARQLEKRGGMPRDVAQEIRRKAHQESLRQSEGDALRQLQYLRRLPEQEKTPRLILTAARALARAEEITEAANLLEEMIENSPEWWPELITLYGQLAAREATPVARIARAESWLRAHPQDSALLLALGKMCERQKLWGKARSYLDASLSIAPCRAAYLALARLSDSLNDKEAANRAYRLAAEQDE
ncbi:MAG: hypothetical protein LBG69_06365 [Zoogloeaceae bacterium]|jgi:HemY protein|nr:hypothetical protein [Zoogloeaceae bacterium]